MCPNASTWLRIVFSVVILLSVFCLNLLLQNRFQTQAMNPMIFAPGVFPVSWRTQGYHWGIDASLIRVPAVNWASATVCRMRTKYRK